MHRAPKIAPLDEGSSRQIWVGWGSTLAVAFVTYLSGGAWWAYCGVFAGLAVALRGHHPRFFIRHIEAQVIAGTPARNEESIKAWLVMASICLVLGMTASVVQGKLVPPSSPTTGRPWVSIEPSFATGHIPPIEAGGSPAVNLLIINSSPVPAQQVSNWTKYEVLTHVLTKQEEDRFFNSLEANLSKSAANAFTLPANSRNIYGTIWFPHPTTEQAADLKADKLFVYFGVLITYEDDNSRHSTELCEFFSGPVFRLCSSHNVQR
jgi:hypothetical protein